MSDKTIGLAILGHGVVGGGVIRILREQAGLLSSRTGLQFAVKHIVVRDPAKHAKQSPGDASLFSGDATRAIDDPAVSIVVELIGGTTLAFEYVSRALKQKKHVITANKSLLAARGAELFALAKQNGVSIAFEASCGGGVPIVDALQRGLLANRIDALVGIVNGTCNVILTRMTKNGWDYSTALKEAQELGFAEADPTLDVSGRDAAQKLTILSSLAFGVRVSESDIYVEGIDQLQSPEFTFAKELGYVIKLLGIAERANGKIALRVHPTLVHQNDVLAEVGGSFNAISVYGNALGHALFYGRGAGQMPTASAVVSDLIDVALGSYPVRFAQLRVYPDTIPAAEIQPIAELQSRYYLRLMVRDVPGTIAQITQILGQHGISISAILQREDNSGKVVPLVVTTHLAAEGAVNRAIAEIDALGCVQPKTVRLRIIDQPKEFSTDVAG